MGERCAKEKQDLYGRRCPIPESCDALEALLRIELLEQIPDELTKKATIVGCTSSSSILFLCWNGVVPNEDATRFDLVEELYMLPQKPLANWLSG